MFWRFSAGVMVMKKDAALKAAALHLRTSLIVTCHA